MMVSCRQAVWYNGWGHVHASQTLDRPCMPWAVFRLTFSLKLRQNGTLSCQNFKNLPGGGCPRTVLQVRPKRPSNAPANDALR